MKALPTQHDEGQGPGVESSESRADEARSTADETLRTLGKDVVQMTSYIEKVAIEAGKAGRSAEDKRLRYETAKRALLRKQAILVADHRAIVSSGAPEDAPEEASAAG
jgi:hypothetical protein